MTRILLIRHAHSVANDRGILAGRSAGVVLTDHGKKQAIELAKRLHGISVASIHISPIERCHLTMAPFLEATAKAKRPKVLITDDLSEVDYGKWTGRKLSSLYRHKLWKTVQNRPSAMYFPDGEGLANVQVRAMRALHKAAATPGNHILVSHGDVIKAMIAHLLKMKLDNFQSLIVDPASITVIDFDGESARLIAYNDTSSNCEKFGQIPKSMKALLGGGAVSKSRRRR